MMRPPPIHKFSFSGRLLHVLRVFLPIVLVLGAIAFMVYRMAIGRWPKDMSGSEFELILLGICAVLLLLLFFANGWRFVRAKISEDAMRSSLMQSDARFKILLDTIPDLIWMKDVQGVYLSCNPAFEEFFGKTESEIVGKTDYDFVSEEISNVFRSHDRAALDAGNARTNEEWVTFADDGRRVLLETIKIPVRTGDGNVAGILGVARDITRRHEAEEEAKLFRNLVELSNDPIYALDPADNFRMVFINQAACRHFGASREEIVHWRVADWDPVVKQADLAQIEEKAKQGVATVFETRHRLASGAVVPVEVSINYIEHQGKELSAGYIRDISERKRAEQALREAHQRLLDLTSNVPGLVFQYRLAPDGSFSYPFIGNTVEKMCGLSPEDIYANPAVLFSFVHPDDVKAFQVSIRASARTLQSRPHEFRANLPKYGLRWLLETSCPERQPDGSIVWHGFITDITKLKRTEVALNQSREQLRQLVAHQDRIREDERKRVALDVHDELGQRLLAMKIELSMLPQIAGEPSIVAERVEALMQQIDSTIKSVRAIINNLRPSVLDLGLFAALDWLEKKFERSTGIVCELTGNEDELQLEEGLATTLFRVIQEGLTNVQQHANATHVRVDLQRVDGQLVITMADNGIGLTEASDDGKDKFGLVGIRERIGILGGKATIEDQEGGGTLLTISLPERRPGDMPASS